MINIWQEYRINANNNVNKSAIDAKRIKTVHASIQKVQFSCEKCTTAHSSSGDKFLSCGHENCKIYIIFIKKLIINYKSFVHCSEPKYFSSNFFQII